MERETLTIDAAGKPMGRLASEIAVVLRGKHKPSFQPHMDCGDMVLVKNIDQMVLSGKKLDQKVYHRSTRYPGGIRTTSLKNLRSDNPEKLLKMCVRKMLPDVKFRGDMLKRLTVE